MNKSYFFVLFFVTCCLHCSEHDSLVPRNNSRHRALNEAGRHTSVNFSRDASTKKVGKSSLRRRLKGVKKQHDEAGQELNNVIDELGTDRRDCISRCCRCMRRHKRDIACCCLATGCLAGFYFGGGRLIWNALQAMKNGCSAIRQGTEQMEAGCREMREVCTPLHDELSEARADLRKCMTLAKECVEANMKKG